MQTEKRSRRCRSAWKQWHFHRQITQALKQGLIALIVAAGLWMPAASWAQAPQSWIQVDTRTLSLTVFSAENHVLARFSNISIGSGGTAEIHLRGDETTPLGVFHVAWIDRHSRYGTFYGFDYPSKAIALRAYAEGTISQAQRDAIIKAMQQHRVPPQNTPLGGRLGIHGLGRGDPDIHRAINWTDGCVALTNPQIRQLARWMRIGTRVVIH
jgi:murein L,D-transpeptidase YafK